MPNAEMSQSPLRVLYNMYPGAFFLIETVMHRAQPDWNAILEKADIIDVSRLENIVRRAVNLADWRLAGAPEEDFKSRFPARHQFLFYRYREVQAQPVPTLFACKGCGFVRELSDMVHKGYLKSENLKCPNCKKPLKQVIHVFTHARCSTSNYSGGDCTGR